MAGTLDGMLTYDGLKLEEKCKTAKVIMPSGSC